MRKLITIIGCALAAQVTYADDDVYSELRHINQTYQITQAIAAQGERIVKALEKQNEQHEPLGYQGAASIEIILDKPTPDTRPLPSLVLPSNGLSEADIKNQAPYFGQLKAKQ